MKETSIKDLINNRKIGLYRVGYKHEALLIECLKDVELLEANGLSYSLTYHDEYIAFILHNSFKIL